MPKIVTFVFLVLFPFFLSAQMVVGTDTLYGNEWIDFNQAYYKIQVAQDGAYRLSVNDLSAAGVPVGSISGSEYKIYHLGEEIPIYVSSNGSLGSNDYISFFGEKNRTELEEFLFPNPSTMLHPNFSLFTDTSAYFLTWKTGGAGLRYQAIQNDTTNHPAPTPYFLRKLEKNFQEYWAKKEGGSGSKFSHFDTAEGFSTSLKTNQNQSFSPIAPYLTGPDAQIHVRYAGRGADHHQEIRINNNLITTDEFSGWDVRDLVFDVSASELSSNVNFKMKGLVNANNKVDRSRIGVLSLTYPQGFDFEGQGNYVFGLSGDAQYVEISNFDASQGVPILYDKANGQRIEGKMNGSLVVFQLPQTVNSRQLVLVSGEGTAISHLTPVNFIDYASANSDYLMISNARLFDDGNGHNYVQDYADYRASVAGGNYNPLIVNVQQVYDQFGYGVQRNPIGIRNMVQWAVRHWEKARFVYLVGKGRTYNDIRSATELQEAQATMFVPTFGSPGGDNLFVTSNYDAAPRLAIGRLAVTTADEVRIYLEKVKSQEINQNTLGEQTIAGQAWKKKVIHLGGGGTASEKTLLKNHLNAMAGVIHNTDLGAHIISFFKDVSDPVQQTVPEQIFKAINSGSALLTIFGHASPGSFDYNIDNPDFYDNEGQFPILTSLGCYSGNLFTNQKGISERFCLYEQKGAIGFVAMTNLGYISTLGAFGKKYYEKLGAQTTIGEGLQQVFFDYKDLNSTSDYRRLSEQMLLNGDPAIRIGLEQGPDYLIDKEHVSLGQTTISSRQDSISLDMEIINIGKNYHDSISLKLTHLLPSGQVYLEKTLKFFPQGYSTSVHLSWVNPGSSGLGQNRLLLAVDELNEVEELPQPDAELNNRLVGINGEGLVFFITDNSVSLVEPRAFSIVEKSDIVLMASTSNAFAKSTRYIFQLDTTEAFNSPLLVSTNRTQGGGLIKWRPEITWLDSTVYYWRVSPDSISPDLGYLWTTSSFITSDDTLQGWNQSHFFQFEKDRLEDIEIKRDKDFDFVENGVNIRIMNKVNQPLSSPEYNWNLDGPASSVRPWDYLHSGISVIVADKITGDEWINQGGQYGSQVTGFQRAFNYSCTSEENRVALLHFLRDTIPDGSHVMVMTILNPSYSIYPDTWLNDSINLGYNIFSTLEGQGATKVRALLNLGSVPYTLVYKKGYNVLAEDIAMDSADIIISNFFVPYRRTSGQIQSMAIGPSKSWVDLEWESENYEPGDYDTLNVYGLNESKTDTTILFGDVASGIFSLASVNAEEFPYVVLEYKLQDESARTAMDLRSWKVHFVPYPEMAVNPNAYFQFHGDTIDYGDILTLDVALENISPYSMDSMLLNLTIVDDANTAKKYVKRLPALTSKDVDTVHFEIATTELSIGVNSLNLEANPNMDQREFFHENNYGLLDFYVKGDDEKPMLDVFFDGIHIVDGDLVSAKPEIVVLLDDENEYFRLEDTSLFDIKIKYPDQSLRQVYFSNPMVLFEPAQTSENVAKITYSAEFLQDGAYELILEGKDVSGNLSGSINYKISFEVINTSMVSNVLPYPNPFSTSTRFAYTLTGAHTPDIFTIQIFSINGKVVREITKEEIGVLKIGRHLTEYQWDGRDEYGEQLANGVYLYRIIAKDESNNQIEQYQTQADSYFRNGFGKIVILR